MCFNILASGQERKLNWISSPMAPWCSGLRVQIVHHASVVIPGLSAKKSLPCFMTRTPSGACSYGICELSTSWIDGSFDFLLRFDNLDVWKSFGEHGPLVCFADPRRHHLTTTALDRSDHAI